MPQAKGTFEVKTEPIADSGAFPRLALQKQFHGDLEGTSAGEMMSVMGAVEGSGAYVALERVTGTLAGRNGSFALVHSGTMRRGADRHRRHAADPLRGKAAPLRAGLHTG